MSQVPICASTGGLVDTVKEGYTGFHMGAFNVEVCDFTSMVYLYMVHSHLDIPLVAQTLTNCFLNLVSAMLLTQLMCLR